MRDRASYWAMLAVAGCLCRPTVGAAQKANAGLSYDAPADCPDARSFENLVLARTEAPFPDPQKPIEVTVKSGDAKLVGTLRLRSARGENQGERTLEVEAGQCEALVEALALSASSLLAQFVDATSAETSPPPPPPPVPPAWPESPPPPDPPAAPPTPATSDTKSSLHWSVFAGPSLSIARSPNLALGASLGLGVQTDALSVSLGGLIGLQPEAAVLESGHQLESSVLLGSVAGCFVRAPLEICAAFDLGVLSGQISATSGASDEQFSVMATLGLRPKLRIELGDGWFLRPWAGAQASLVRPSVYVRDIQVWSMPFISGDAGVELVLMLN